MIRTRSGRCIKENSTYSLKQKQRQERQNQLKKIKQILTKDARERSSLEQDILNNSEDLVKHVDLMKRKKLTSEEHHEIFVDDRAQLEEKCAQLAKAMAESKSTVVYTGAGISTAASIPDYRGPTGLWTMLERGLKIEMPDFALVRPTYSHMALCELLKHGLLSHVVSQNCDGLHLRSGVKREQLSELHGNCFVEFCPECLQEYIRLFDVTEKSSFRKHMTNRQCKSCTNHAQVPIQLRDSIIHFGERLRNGDTYNWDRATEQVRNAELIICLGTSLKVLKHYKCLWPKRSKGMQNMYIVNIQWTPKDKQAKMKINAYCDDVMQLLIENLNKHHAYSIKVGTYSVANDPLFDLAHALDEHELNTTKKNILNKTGQAGHSDQNDQTSSNGDKDGSSNSWISQSFKKRRKN